MPRALPALLLAALLAGCAQAPSGGGTSGSATTTPAAIEPHPEDTDPQFPGLRLSGEVTGGSPWRAIARAHNAGPESYKVEAICRDAWAVEVQDAAGATVPTGPGEAVCEAFGLAPFEAEEELVKAFSWNGTRYGEQGHRPAAPGAYAIVVSFRVYKGGSESHEYDTAAVLSVRLPVQVA